MNFNSTAFLAFIFFAMIALVGLFSKERLRTTAIILINFIFIGSFFEHGFLGFFPVILFLIIGYACIVISSWRTGGIRNGLLILLVLALFVWIKKYTLIEFLPQIPFPYIVVGLSFMLFRLIHIIIDVYQGEMSVPSIPMYIAYMIFFLTLSAGPIWRYDDFAKSHKHPEYPADIAPHLRRVASGYIFLTISGWMISGYGTYFQAEFYNAFNSGLYKAVVINLSISSLLYAVYLYLNFQGYMHIMIGLGRLFGYKIPENFNAPWRAENFLDLWSRWHITLSEWFKYYLFNPALKMLTVKYGGSFTINTLGVITFFITFMIMGLWHGTSKIFFFYGLILGSAVSINKIYQLIIVKFITSKNYKLLKKNIIYINSSKALALSFFCIALICIWVNLGNFKPFHGFKIVYLEYIFLAWGIIFSNLLILFFCIDLLNRNFSIAFKEIKINIFYNFMYLFIAALITILITVIQSKPIASVVYQGY